MKILKVIVKAFKWYLYLCVGLHFASGLLGTVAYGVTTGCGILEALELELDEIKTNWRIIFWGHYGFFKERGEKE